MGYWEMYISFFICGIFQTAMVVRGYETCWDGTLAVEYSGTISTTTTNRTCQNWALDFPQSHGYHNSPTLILFTKDGNDSAAANYCRDPDGTSGTSGTWCFTTDPLFTWDSCDIPLCTNLPCSAGVVVGQTDPALTSTFVDSNSGTNYLLTTTTYSIQCCGTVQQWRVHIKNTGTVRLQIWRENTTTGEYKLLGENVYTYSSGQENNRHDENVIQSSRISVEEGDLIGWYTTADMLSYATGTTNNNLLLPSASAASAGNSISFAAATAKNSADFAIGLEVAQSLAPSFTNTDTTVSISETTAIGIPVFTLSYTDQDPDDVNSLVLTMATDSYFELSGNGKIMCVVTGAARKTQMSLNTVNSVDSDQRFHLKLFTLSTTNSVQPGDTQLVYDWVADVVVRSVLTDMTDMLDFTVTDHCGQTGVFTLTVTITAVSVSITSLTDSVSVSESTTAETLLHTLVVYPADDTYTCVIDSYEPTRPEGNPFIIKNTTTADNAVYLASAANVRYNTAIQLNVTVTCTNSGATDSDTGSLIVNIDPNSNAQYNNFVGSATFSARSTTTNDVVYTANVTDPESDPIAMSLTCDPAGCPFGVNNAFQVYATSDLTLHQQATYVVILTADDGFNGVDSANISFVISDINAKPVFTNLPGSAITIDENEVIGTSVFQVSHLDANGDPVSYTATYNSTDCAAMFDINSAGLVTTKIVFDYETAGSLACTVHITAFDTYEYSDPVDLVVNVGDVDEPPVMSGSAFTINTEEVADNTALPNQGISATDPESTTVSLSLDCGADTGHLGINPTTGIVTMTTNYDLETAGVDTYTILCNITATDATSLTATASLSVTVTDGNDVSPVFIDAGYATIIALEYSGFGTILTVSATDGDRTSPNNAITYSLTPTTEFNIDPSGNIYNTANLSSATAGTVYALAVTATDGGAPPLTDTVNAVIIISSTAATTTASSDSDSGSDDFFSSIGNIILLAIAGFIALVVSVLLGIVVWKFCVRNSGIPEQTRYRPKPTKPKPPKAPSDEGPRKEPKLNNNEVHPKRTQEPSFGRAQGYHRPRHLEDYFKDKNKPVESVRRSGEWLDPTRVSPTRINVNSLHNV